MLRFLMLIRSSKTGQHQDETHATCVGCMCMCTWLHILTHKFEGIRIFGLLTLTLNPQ